MAQRVATLVIRRPAWVLGATQIVVVAALILGFPVIDSMQPAGFDDPASSSVAARTQIASVTHANPDLTLIAVVQTGKPVTSAATHHEVDHVVAVLEKEPLVAETLTASSTNSPLFTSKDGLRTLVVAEFHNTSDTAIERAAGRLQRALSSDRQVVVGGVAVANEQANDIVRSDLVRAELLAFPILFVLLLFVFRGLIAASLPPIVCGTAVAVTLLVLRAINAVLPLSVFALDLVVALGLGLAVDYSLLILSRYREGLARGNPSDTAIRQALSTAGRTVLFSSITVAAALASLVIFPQRFLYSMGVGGLVVTLMAASAALLVLPAILGLLGPRINAFAPKRWTDPAPPSASGGWYRLARFVMHHAGIIAVVTVAVLVALGAPVLNIRLTSIDLSMFPTSTSSRQANDLLLKEFNAHALSPIYAVAAAPDTSAGHTAVAALAASFRTIPDVASVGSPQALGHATWRVDVVSSASNFAAASQDIVSRMRATHSSHRFQVGGTTAQFVDYKQSVFHHVPATVAIIASVIFIVLFLVTGSVILPIKSFVMNIVTLTATFGILVTIFQDGHLAGLFGFTSQGAIESSQPVVLIALVFGLSTDYGVFLLSRIKEARDGGASNEEAVAAGIERTGRIVTAAALLFCVAMGAIVTSQFVFIKLLGIGTALAVLIDASIVRALLVPSLMKLLGSWNWWAPAFLQPIRNYVRFEEPTYVEVGSVSTQPAIEPALASVGTSPAQAADQTIVLRRPTSETSLVLVVVDGPDRGSTFVVAPDTIIGRDAGNTVRLTDPRVSIRHAVIHRENGQWVMYDLQSANGVWVDGAPRSRHVLQDGDLIVLGHTLIKCRRLVPSAS